MKDKIRNHVKESNCYVSGLPVVTIPSFTNYFITEDYEISLKKIGDSIVYLTGKGNLVHYKIDENNDIIDDFCRQAKVVKPYVQIRDLGDFTGRLSISQLHQQARFFINQTDICGFITINEPTWIRVFINHGIRYFSPKIKVSCVTEYAAAIENALAILGTNKNSGLQGINFNNKKRLFFSDVVFKPDWEFQNMLTGCRHQCGVVYERLLFISTWGTITSEDEIHQISLTFEKALHQGGLANNTYDSIIDLSKMESQPSVWLRIAYSKMIRRVIDENFGKSEFSIVCGASAFLRTVVGLLGPIMSQKFTFVNSVEQAFQFLNALRVDRNSKDAVESDHSSSILVTNQQLQEINNAIGSLLWKDSDENKLIDVSADNPLKDLVNSLDLLRFDLLETKRGRKNCW
jgi:hypothetical protein